MMNSSLIDKEGVVTESDSIPHYTSNNLNLGMRTNQFNQEDGS